MWHNNVAYYPEHAARICLPHAVEPILHALRMRSECDIFVTFCAMLESQNLIINQLIQIHLPEHGAHTSPCAPYRRPFQRRITCL